MKKVFVLMIMLIITGAGFYYWNNKEVPVDQGTDDSNSEKEINVELKLNQEGGGIGVSITPLQVVEDSRCPTDVQCIWAGTVKVRAILVSGLGTANQIFELNKPITTEVEVVELIDVKPGKNAETPIFPAQYRLTFKISKRQISSY